MNVCTYIYADVVILLALNCTDGRLLDLEQKHTKFTTVDIKAWKIMEKYGTGTGTWESSTATGTGTWLLTGYSSGVHYQYNTD